jgi:hypothetical protein
MGLIFVKSRGGDAARAQLEVDRALEVLAAELGLSLDEPDAVTRLAVALALRMRKR